MAISYIPGAAGWNDTAGLGQNARLRLKVESSYSAALNRSTLTVTLQCYAPQYGGEFFLLDTALIRCNGTALLDGGGAQALNYYIYFHQGEDGWYELADSVTGETVHWSAAVDHAADGSASAAFFVRARLRYAEGGYYMTFSDCEATQTLDVTRQFTLTLSAGTGSTVTVLRNGTALTNGAALTYGDVLTVRFAAQTGYDLATHTVNGASFASGGTHTVTGAVTAAATATRKRFLLTVSAGAGCTVTVLRGGTALSGGALVTYGDVLTIRLAAQEGYEAMELTVNGAAFASGGTHTVTGPVSVAGTARRLGLLRLDDGSEIRRVRLMLDTGSAIVPVRIFLDRGDRITEAGT